ncbi:MAG: hypothetical protein IPO95_16235 [Rhodanobacteraceae bacterium]|nr:hypothetical protein [Rhodanobacteraceae bacterium]
MSSRPKIAPDLGTPEPDLGPAPVLQVGPDVPHVFGIDAISRAHRHIVATVDLHVERIDALWLAQHPPGQRETLARTHVLSRLRRIETTDRRKSTRVRAVESEFEPDEALADAVQGTLVAIMRGIEIAAQAPIEQQCIGTVERIFLDHQQHPCRRECS